VTLQRSSQGTRCKTLGHALSLHNAHALVGYLLYVIMAADSEGRAEWPHRQERHRKPVFML